MSTRLRLYHSPLRLAVSASPWRSASFLLSYVLMGTVLFAVVLTATATTAALAITLAGLPLLVASSALVRGCASAERWRLRLVLPGPVRGGYRPVTQPGIMSQIRTRWLDPATWRDLAYLIGLWPPLLVLDVAVFAVWLTLLAGVTMPAWYWAPPQTFDNGQTAHGIQLGYFPNGPHGPGGAGLYVDTLPKALLAAAGFLVVFLLFNYVLVLTARAHARIAASVLRAPGDPLADAKEVLSRPGPLGPLYSAR